MLDIVGCVEGRRIRNLPRNLLQVLEERLNIHQAVNNQHNENAAIANNQPVAPVAHDDSHGVPNPDHLNAMTSIELDDDPANIREAFNRLRQSIDRLFDNFQTILYSVILPKSNFIYSLRESLTLFFSKRVSLSFYSLNLILGK